MSGLSDLTHLHLLIGLFYALECVRLVPPNAVLWRAGRWWTPKWPSGSILFAGRAVLWLP